MAPERHAEIELLLEESRVLREQCQLTLSHGDALRARTVRLLGESEIMLAHAVGVSEDYRAFRAEPDLRTPRHAPPVVQASRPETTPHE